MYDKLIMDSRGLMIV
jgi:hypothetical protein